MDFGVERIGGITIVELPMEELDAGNSEIFKESVLAELAEDGKVVFDLRRVRFVDSSGCGALLSCLKELNDRGGDLKFCNVRDPVRMVFELIRLNRLISFHDSHEAAMAAFVKGSG